MKKAYMIAAIGSGIASFICFALWFSNDNEMSDTLLFWASFNWVCFVVNGYLFTEA